MISARRLLVVVSIAIRQRRSTTVVHINPCAPVRAGTSWFDSVNFRVWRVNLWSK